MSEKQQQKSNRGYRYSFLPVIATTIFLSFSGTFQIGFQDIYYEHYRKALNPGANEWTNYISTGVPPEGSNSTFDGTKFIPQVSHYLIYFYLGSAIGSLLFGLIFLRLGAKWSYLLFSGLGILTSALIALGDVMNNYFLTLLIIRTLYGICIGFLTCLQVSVLNDISYDEDQMIFNFCTIVAVPIGYFAGLYCSEQFLAEGVWYFGHLISIIPLLLGFTYVLLFFRDPPSSLIIKGNDEKAMKSARHYYGNFNARYVLAETHNRVKLIQSIPTPITIWSDKVALKALFLAAIVNFVAGFSGDRFTWIFLYRYCIAYKDDNALLFFVMFFSLMGTMFCALILNKHERKHLLIVTAALVVITEFIFGFYWQFTTLFQFKEDSLRIAIASAFRALQHLFLTAGVNSVAFFVATDLAFSGNKSILISISFTIRAITTAFHPYIIGHLYELSPLAASILTAIPFIGFSIFVGLRFPRLQSLTPYQILQTFGYTVNLEATAEEIQNVRKNMHKLWQNPKES